MPSKTHGMTKTRFYKIWVGIRFRCDSQKSTNYKYWGGKGVSYIEKWRKFEEFKKDMYESYLDHVKVNGIVNTTIDRKENSLIYSKNTCVWATRTEQNVNRKTTIFFTYKGKTQCLKHWCKDLGLKYKTVWQRINGYNWPIEKALNLTIN